MFRLPFISSLAILVIAACNDRGPVDAQARVNAPLPNVSAQAPTVMGESHGMTAPAGPPPSPAAKIPASLHGRWALVPTDCSALPGATKGLLIVTPEHLKFVQSSAVPISDVGADDTSIGGNFAFTGEGRSWTKYEALKVSDHRLTRTEINPTASFSYAKCN